jgi:hypothetical protein
MKVLTITCLALAALAAAGLSDRINAKGDQGPKILAKASWNSNQLASRVGVLRDAEGAAALFEPLKPAKWTDPATQKEATAKLAKLFKVDSINWSKQMMLLVEAGQRKTGGYSVEVTGLEVKDQVLTVKWKVNEPKPGSPVSPEPTFPGAALLVERFEGKVTFDPLPK